MKQGFRQASLCFLALLLFVSAWNLQPAVSHADGTQTDLYVSVSGSDSNPGTSELPFATLGKARDAVRAINSDMTGDIVVHVKEGDYSIASALTFTHEDSGTNGYQVRYVSEDGPGKARLIGSQKLPQSGWESVDGNVYRHQIGTGLDVQTLYDGGQRSVLARYPNEGYLYARKEFTGQTKKKFHYLPGDIPDIANLSKLQALLYPSGVNWTFQIINVAAIDRANETIELQKDATLDGGVLAEKTRYFLQGARELLDQTGEFFYDGAEGYLYYWPLDSQLDDIYLPVSSDLIRLVGTSTNWVEQITFDGLTLTATKFDNNEPHSSHGNIYMTYTRNITITNAKITQSGFYGIMVDGRNEFNTFSGNYMDDIGISGIYLSGVRDTAEDTNHHHVITNNYINNVVQFYGYGGGIYAAFSGYNTITNNKISNSNRYGISMKGSAWSTLKTKNYAGMTYENRADYMPSKYNLVKDNDVSYTNLDSHDTGGIESWGSFHNTIERNRVYNSGGFGMQFGLYLDDDSSYAIIRENIFYGIVGSVRSENTPAELKGVYNVVENNIFDYSASVTGLISSEFQAHLGDVSNNLTLRKNIFYSNTADPNLGAAILKFTNWIPAKILESDYNVFYNSKGADAIAGVSTATTLTAWKGLGYDANSITGNPQFEDAANGDYRLKAGSPALALGITTIDADQIGLTDDFLYDVPSGATQLPTRAPLPLVSKPYIVNPGFEDSLLVPWFIRNATAEVVNSPSGAHSGDKYIRLYDRTQPWGTARQNIEVKNGTRYTISAWARLTIGSDRGIMNADVLYTDDSADYRGLFTTPADKPITTEWTEIKGEYVFNDSKPIARITLYPYTETSKAEWHLDDITIVAHNSTLSSNSGSFDKRVSSAGYQDASTTLTLDGNALNAINLNGSVVDSANYTVSGAGDTRTVTLKKEYLKTLAVASHAFNLDMNYGDDPVWTIAVSDSTGSIPPDESASVSFDGPASVTVGNSFDIQVSLNQYGKVAMAQALTVTFDPAVLEWTGATSLDEDKFVVADFDDTVPGTVRLLNVFLGDGQTAPNDEWLQLGFSVKAGIAATTTSVTATDVRMADYDEVVESIDGASLTIAVTAVSKTALSTLLTESQTTHDNAVEGKLIGQYPTGTKATLQSAIDAAALVAADTQATQAAVDAAYTSLRGALDTFLAAAIAEIPGDLDNDGQIGLADLVRIVKVYGKTSDAADWHLVSRYDIVADGVIDIVDLAAVARMIFNW